MTPAVLSILSISVVFVASSPSLSCNARSLPALDTALASTAVYACDVAFSNALLPRHLVVQTPEASANASLVAVRGRQLWFCVPPCPHHRIIGLAARAAYQQQWLLVTLAPLPPGSNVSDPVSGLTLPVEAPPAPPSPPTSLLEQRESQPPSAATPYTPSARLIASGLFSPAHSPCADETMRLTACVRDHASVAACAQQQAAYMRCHRLAVTGSVAAADDFAVNSNMPNGGAPQPPADVRFAASTTQTTTAASVSAGSASASLAVAAASIGVSATEAEALCSVLGGSDCPAQVMSQPPLPLPGGGLHSGGAPGFGPFGPDLSAAAGLVIGAIIHGVVGPEIVEMVQSFVAKIVTVVPPVLRKVMVDGVDPLSSLPTMPVIPDPQVVIAQVQAQVAAARAMAESQLARAKAAVALARAQADAELARVTALRAEMDAIKSGVMAEAARKLSEARAAAEAVRAAAAAHAAELRAQAEAAKAAAQEAAAAATAAVREQAEAAIRDARGAIAPDVAASLQAALASARSLQEVTRAVSSAAAALPADASSALSAGVAAATASASAAAARAADVSAASSAAASAVPTTAVAETAAAVSLLRQVDLPDSEIHRFVMLPDDALAAAASSGNVSQSAAAQAALPALSARYSAAMGALQASMQLARASTAALKSSVDALAEADMQRSWALEESEAVRQAIAEETQLREERQRRMTGHGQGTVTAEHPQAAVLAETSHGTRAPSGQAGGRKGILAVILHYDLVHSLTTSLTLGITRDFAASVIPSLFDALEPTLRTQLVAVLPRRIADAVGPALEASVMATVPGMLERTLPGIVSRGVLIVATQAITKATGAAVGETVAKALLFPPELSACCERCRLEGAPAPCACCTTTWTEQAPHLVPRLRRLVSTYASHYAPAAVAMVLDSTQPPQP